MLSVIETKDAVEIKKVLCHPEIYPRIGGELIAAEDFNPPMTAQYLAGYVNGEIIGLMIYNLVKGKMKCHYQVLPEYRRKYSRELMRMVLGRTKNASIYAEIPKCYPEVIRFAKDFDFKVIGNKPESHLNSGVYYDVTVLRLNHGIH